MIRKALRLKFLGFITSLAIVFVFIQNVSTKTIENIPSSVDNYQIAEQVDENTKLIDYITLVITIAVPFIGFFWWLINSQQERKIIEFAQIEDDKFKVLIEELLCKYENEKKEIKEELKNILNKIENVSEDIQKNKIEALLLLHEQDVKFMKMNKEIEKFLCKSFKSYNSSEE